MWLSTFNRPFARHVATLASGTAASQIISLLSAPLITRLYGPEAYGIQGVFVTVVTVIATVAAMSYPNAIVLPKTDGQATILAKLSLIIGLIVCLVLTLLIQLYGNKVLSAINAGEITDFKHMISPAVYLVVLGSVASQWLNRKRLFSLTSRVGALTSVITVGAKAAVGFLYPSATALVIVNMFGSFISTLLMKCGQKKVDGTKRRRLQSNVKMYFMVLAAYKDFVIFRTPQSLLNAIAVGVPVIYMSTAYGVTSVGLYSIATAILAAPSAIIGGSIMQVFYPRFNDAARQNENLSLLFDRATKGMAVIGIVPFLGIALMGPTIFRVAFGLEWESAGLYARWLALGQFFAFVSRPSLIAIPVFRKQGALLIYEFISLPTKVGALYIGTIFVGSDLSAIAVFSIFNALLSIGITCYVYRLCSRRKAN
jgi:O-antigen/teichoic acid export membrane protein